MNAKPDIDTNSASVEPSLKGTLNLAAYDSVPQEMREGPQWVAWRGADRSGKPTKIPINPHDGCNASTTDPATWGTLEEANSAVQSGYATGVGFVLTAEAGIVGIDLDDCLDPATGELNQMARRIVERFDSYTEVSPSGCGVHIFVRGTLPLGTRRKNSVEMYNSGRYFTVSGIRIETVSEKLEDRQEAIDALHAWISEDAKIVEEAQTFSNSPFTLLWEGKWEDAAYPSQSEADLALCNVLAKHTKDPTQLDRIFRWSGLMRDKWNESRDSKGQTYGELTIAKALATGSAPNPAKGKKPPVDCSAEDFLKRVIPPKEPLLEGLLSTRDQVCLVGRRREGKTSLSMNLGVALAAGMPEFLGYVIPKPRRTLLVLLEDDAGEVQEKLTRIIGSRDLGGRLRILTRDDFLNASILIDVRQELFRKTILEAALRQKPELIVIDNLAHVIAAEYNDSNRVHELMDFCYRLANEHGSAIIVCAHPKKEDLKNPLNLAQNPVQFFEAVMGSSHFVNSTGSLWGIQRPQGKDHSLFLGGRQRVEGHQSVSYITMDEHGWFHLDDNIVQNLQSVLNTPARNAAWKLLPEPPETFGYSAAEDLVKGVMRSSSTFHKWFSECRRLRVIVESEGKYVKADSVKGVKPKRAEGTESSKAA